MLAYAPNRVSDLLAEREHLTKPVVYHLLGRVAASPTYVITDEDLLEFFCGLQSRPCNTPPTRMDPSDPGFTR